MKCRTGDYDCPSHPPLNKGIKQKYFTDYRDPVTLVGKRWSAETASWFVMRIELNTHSIRAPIN
jgi:hypothetical protein